MVRHRGTRTVDVCPGVCALETPMTFLQTSLTAWKSFQLLRHCI